MKKLVLTIFIAISIVALGQSFDRVASYVIDSLNGSEVSCYEVVSGEAADNLDAYADVKKCAVIYNRFTLAQQARTEMAMESAGFLMATYWERRTFPNSQATLFQEYPDADNNGIERYVVWIIEARTRNNFIIADRTRAF